LLSTASKSLTSCPSLSQHCKIVSTLDHSHTHKALVNTVPCVCARVLRVRSGVYVPTGTSGGLNEERGREAATQSECKRVLEPDCERLHAALQGALTCCSCTWRRGSAQHNASTQARSRPLVFPDRRRAHDD
jgi:hypothetical protein